MPTTMPLQKSRPCWAQCTRSFRSATGSSGNWASSARVAPANRAMSAFIGFLRELLSTPSSLGGNCFPVQIEGAVGMPSDRSALARAAALLGPLEGRIMRAVWSGAVGKTFVVRDIQQLMPELAYTTVMTTLARLAQKGLLTAKSVPKQKAHRYEAVGNPAEFLAHASRQDVGEIVRRYGDAALAAFAEELDRLSIERRRRLEEFVK